MAEHEDLSLSQRMHASSSAENLTLQSNGLQEREHGKVINDPIHKHFWLGPTAVQIMDSPQFQRLRELKQLGLSYYVFPGASHNRFEHCLGVAHLAYELALHFKFGQPELEITSDDLKIVQLAGLCHDLGHGPFSHVFDYGFLREQNVGHWSHEEMSVKILDTIVEDKGLLDSYLSKNQLDRIKAMILAAGANAQPAGDGRQYLHEIVANGRNGLDVDKYDYLSRDAYCCGVPMAAELNRLKTFSKVIDNEICYKWSEYSNVLQVFQTRASLHQRVYGHRKAKAIDHMVVDCLRAANPVLQITDKVHDPREFVKLDDSILKRIEYFGAFTPNWQESDVDDSHIQEAQAILKRLRCRDLYKYCGEFVIPNEDIAAGWEKPRPQEIAEMAPDGSSLSAGDIIVMEVAIDLTAGNRNPLDNVSFFENLGSTAKFPLRNEHMTRISLKDYAERILRVYSKRSDKAHVEAVRAASERWIRQRFGNRVTCSTPARPYPSQSLPDRTPATAAFVQPNRKRRLAY